jgi:DHA1 family bicyclomycin/chloramphenicol resistance-like MFS transporter
MLVCGLSQAAAIVYLPATAEIQAVFGASEAGVQFLLTAFIVPFSLALPFVGPISDRVGRRSIMLGGLCLFIAGNLLAALAPNFETLIVARAIQGLGSCPIMILPRAMIRDMDAGPAAARALTYTSMALSLSQIIAPVFGGLLLGLLGWAGGFYALAAISVPALLLVLRLPETATGGGAAGKLVRSFMILLTIRRFVANAVGMGLLNGAFYAFFTAAPIVYMKLLGFSPQEFSIVMMLWGVGFFITGFVVTRTVSRISAHATILAGGALNIATAAYWIAMAIIESNPLYMVFPVMTFAAANALFVPRAMNVALTAAPVEIAGAASALIALSQWGFSALGSAAASALPHETPLTVGLLMLAFILLSLFAYLAGGKVPAATKGV